MEKNMTKKGFVVSFEGGEGVGKTTILEMLQEYLGKQHIDYICTREPGGVHISEQIREVVLDKDNTEMDGRTEAMLFAAARRQHLVQKVLPALEEGKLVIFDRYVDSSLVYQGYVRGISIEEVFELNQFAIKGLLPDITIYFDLDPEIGLARINKDKNREINRLDLEGKSFHAKVREGYLLLCERFSDRIRLVDANNPVDVVFDQVLSVLKEAGVIK